MPITIGPIVLETAPMNPAFQLGQFTTIPTPSLFSIITLRLVSVSPPFPTVFLKASQQTRLALLTPTA